MIKAWLAFDVVALDRNVASSSLEKHLDKISSVPAVKEIERKLHEPVETEFRGKKAYSAAAELTAEFNTFHDLINTIIVYGPSAIEILSPDKMEIDMAEMQDVCNVVAGMMHRFASAGVGGLVINTEK